MKYQEHWKVLVYIYFFTLVFALTFQSIPPLLGFLVQSLGISHTQAGALMSLFGLPGILISIPGGILADVYGPKRVGITALLITLIGSLLVGLGKNYSLLLTGRIISGIGGLTISIVAPQALSRWFDSRDLGKAMGIFNTAMPLGSIFTLNTFSVLAGIYTWQIPLLLTSFFCLGVLVLVYFRYPELPDEIRRQKQPEFKEKVLTLRKTGPQVWLVAAIWMMYNASTISYLTFGADYYQYAGYDVNYASFLTSLLMVGSLLFSPLVGTLTDRVGRKEYFIIVGSIAIALLLYFVPRTLFNPIIIGGLIGFFAASIPSPVFSLVPKYISLAQVGLGYGILSTCLNIGILLGPLLVGFSYDQTQNYLVGFDLMAIFALFTALITLLLLLLNRLESGNQA
ncbi:MAG: MFS transporter [Atribacterota bacterium]